MKSGLRYALLLIAAAAPVWDIGALKPAARVGILDTTFPTDQHGTPPWLLECELAQVGYTKTRTIALGADAYLAILRAPARGAIPAPSTVRARVAEGTCLQR